MRKTPRLPRKQLGFWGAVIGAGASLLGGAMANDANKDLASQSWEVQRDMRQNAYQDTVFSLKQAGLNPMLAYMNGANATPTVHKAESRNIAEGMGNSAAAFAGIENIKAQNELIRAQTAKTLAESNAIPSSVANVEQQTANLRVSIPKINAEIQQIKLQSRTEEERSILTRAQKFLTETQDDLTKKQITNVEALTRTQDLISVLKDLEVPGARNIADYEKALSTGVGNAATLGGKVLDKVPAIGKIKGILGNSVKGITKGKP